MKNAVKKMVFSVSVLAVCFSFFACAYYPASQDYIVMRKNGVVMQTNIVSTRDFTTLGLIFVESSAVLDPNGTILSGSKITFEMLMREARKLNADDIINIKIDEIERISTTVERTGQSTNASGYTSSYEERSTVRTVDYKANALAIKYK